MKTRAKRPEVTSLAGGQKGQSKTKVEPETEVSPSAQPSLFHDSGWNQAEDRAYPNKPVSRVDNNSPIPNGKGSSLHPRLRSRLENHFNTPLSQVSVHEGVSSRAAADKMGAFAFTYGQSIHLGSAGLSLPENKRNALIAHEVTHTIQQRNARPSLQASEIKKGARNSRHEIEADRASAEFSLAEKLGGNYKSTFQPSPVSTPLIQAADDLKTDWGEFIVERFEPLTDSNGRLGTDGKPLKRGVELFLKFMPNEKVEAKKIGLTQAVKVMLANSTPEVWGIEGYQQMSSGDETTIGYHIDNNRDGADPNPMYQVDPSTTQPENSNKLGDRLDVKVDKIQEWVVEKRKKENEAKGYTLNGSEWGYNYHNEAGDLVGPKDTSIVDAPSTPVVGGGTGQLLETAALCVEGNDYTPSGPNQEGLYYGSVIWGWERDNQNNFIPTPPKVISKGPPSNSLMASISKWNPSKVRLDYIFYGGGNGDIQHIRGKGHPWP